jgi:hypothetical protein
MVSETRSTRAHTTTQQRKPSSPGTSKVSLIVLPKQQAKLTPLPLFSRIAAAALHLTTLYRTSLSSNKDSFREGYLAALNDVLLTLGERRRITGNAGYSRDGDANAAVRPWESAQEQLEWLERYLRGRTEAMRSEAEGDDEPTFAPSTVVPRSNEIDEHRRGSSPSMNAGLREQTSEAAGSPFRAPTDPNARTPMHSMRLRNRNNIDSSSAAPSPSQQRPSVPRSRSVTSSNAAPTNERTGTEDSSSAPAAALSVLPNASFTFQSERSPATAQLGFSQFQTGGEAGRIARGLPSAAEDGEDVKKQDPRNEESNKGLRDLEAQLDAQRARQGNGNGKGLRRSAPIDVDEELSQASALGITSAFDIGCAASSEDAGNAEASAERLPAPVAGFGGGEGSLTSAFASSTSLPHDKKRIKLETERKIQQFRDHHQFGKKRRDR